MEIDNKPRRQSLLDVKNLEGKKQIIKDYMHTYQKLKILDDWEDRRIEKMKKMETVITTAVFQEETQKIVKLVNKMGAKIIRAEKGCVISYLEFDDENGLEKFWDFHESGGLSKYLTDLALPDDEMRHLEGGKTLCVQTVALDEDYLAWKHYFNGTRPPRSRKNKQVTVVEGGCIVGVQRVLVKVTSRPSTDEPRKHEGQLQGSRAEGMDHHAQLVVDMMQQISLSAATDTPLLGATSSEPHEGRRQRRKSGERKKHRSGEGKKH
ncbi:PREDICTED: uncharacterized protein LOC109469171 [Branchiostoma belcheri]|uniref:Uncharacterized protein LOC109469171 n=1 Tax=Branchiostoma belcheri TaxID=7741 RepID=A0A6P4YPB4_BRABE|nr:PREDICTED: uncharacterized protein LOC109469171 [Branchiostoma belcheri]